MLPFFFSKTWSYHSCYSNKWYGDGMEDREQGLLWMEEFHEMEDDDAGLPRFVLANNEGGSAL